MRWTRKGILAEIKRLQQAGAELNYASASDNHLNLVRAACWHFGSWEHAIEKAGLNYDEVSRYQRWTRERIIARIGELHAQGHDLSWRAVSTRLDPALAAAALRPHHFQSWREAISAAGLDIDSIARYRHWNEVRVCEEIRALHEAGEPLSSKILQENNQALFCAARRRFGSWDNALQAAGIDADTIRIRRAKNSS